MQNLRLFRDVAKLRSFSNAAKLHQITQSAVSQRISQLEKSLGVRLLDRSVRPPALTAAGQLFAREANELVERYDQLLEQLEELPKQLQGSVRVSAIYSAGIDLLQALREDFARLHPSVDVVLAYKRPEQVDRAVRNGDCDIGIVSYPRRWPGMKVCGLREERICVVTRPAHPLSSRHSIRARSLGHYDLIGFDSALPISRNIRQYLRRHGASAEPKHEVDNIDTMKSMLLVEDLVALLPRRTVQREAAGGTLVAIDLIPALNRPIGVIYLQSPPLRQVARAFLDFLVEHADPDRSPHNGSSGTRQGGLRPEKK